MGRAIPYWRQKGARKLPSHPVPGAEVDIEGVNAIPAVEAVHYLVGFGADKSGCGWCVKSTGLAVRPFERNPSKVRRIS